MVKVRLIVDGIDEALQYKTEHVPVEGEIIELTMERKKYRLRVSRFENLLTQDEDYGDLINHFQVHATMVGVSGKDGEYDFEEIPDFNS